MKKFLHEFDDVRTPEGWTEETIEKARKMTEDDMKKLNVSNKKKVSFKLIVLAAALVVLSSSSILAAYKINMQFKGTNTAQSLNHFDTTIDENGNEYTYAGGQEINKSEVIDKLNVTCTKMVADSHNAYIQLSVSTKDGSPLVENSETKVSIAARQTFEKISVKLDGKVMEKRSLDGYYNLQRVDDASEPDKATLELTVKSDTINFSGKHFSVSFENYQDEWYEYEDIGFKYSSIAELAKQGELAAEDEFLPADKVKYSMDCNMKLLNPGNNKIYFSDKYPEAYIDNMGFASRRTDIVNKCFYITIVPGTDANALALQKLIFQNLTTGLATGQKLMSQKNSGGRNVISTETLPDGRIEISLDASADRMYNPTGRLAIDTTMKEMSNFTLRYLTTNLYDSATRGIRYTGKWSFDLDVDTERMDPEINKDVNASVTETKMKKHTVIVNHVSLTSSKLGITANIADKSTWSFEEFPTTGPNASPFIILKDGTRISVGTKADGGGNSNDSKVTYNWYMSALVNPADVEAIEWYGVKINLQ